MVTLLKVLTDLVNAHIVENGLAGGILNDLGLVVQGQEERAEGLGTDGAEAKGALSSEQRVRLFGHALDK